MNAMDLDRFYQLLSRKMAGQATDEELQELFSLIEDDKELFFLYQQLSSPTTLEKEVAEEEADASFALHALKMQMKSEPVAVPVLAEEKKPRHILRPFTWLAVAASVIAIWVGVNYFFEDGRNQQTASATPNEVVTKKASRSTIQLPDGSKVSLNADSKLSYNDDFSGSTREVTLVGEAYFDVAKDSTKPFIIHTEKINIRVLGTAFNVKSYPQDEVIETSLIHGKIEVTYTDRPAEKIILKPNEKLIIRKNQGLPAAASQSLPKIQLNNLVAIRDSLILETAWMDNKLAFTNLTLAEIGRMLERQYDVKVIFKNEEVKSYTYTGLFERETAGKVLELLSLSQPFAFEIKEQEIIIGK